MKLLSPEKIPAKDVGILDNNSEWLGIPKAHLMECAGYSFANEIINRYKLKENMKVAIFCGTGNNGGDGFVIARHLSSFGMKSLVILAGTPNNIRTLDAQLNWSIISKNLEFSVNVKIIKDSTDLGNVAEIIKKDKNYNLIIDGLLGTGIKGKIREPVSSAIETINGLKEEDPERFSLISIDVPSGLDPNSGNVADKAVRADLVITFHRNKNGMKPNTKYIREIVVKSIGIPLEANLFVGKGDFVTAIKTRKIDTHKGQHGRILVIGGSKNYSGAPAYSSLTGIHFGIDLVITYTPEVVGDVIRSYSPNMIVRTSPGDWLNDKSIDEISELIEWANTILIGPGIGLQEETENLLIKLINIIKMGKKALILDADALKLIKNHLDLIKGMSVILTPHEGELKIMAGVELPPYNNIEERGDIILKLAKKLNVTLLVKGPYDYISDGNSLKINRSGCPEMSIGGTGDVLAGLCACFNTLENDPFHSACSAAFLNGYIGEYCKQNIGPRFTAMDMIKCINESILTLMED